MGEALLFGLLASSGLLIGVFLGLAVSVPRRVIAVVMAFGSGVLVSALTFDLMEEALEVGNATYVVGGFLIGAVLYIAMDYLLDRFGAQEPHRHSRRARDSDRSARAEHEPRVAISGTALLIGAVLDGVPENTAIGVSVSADRTSLGLVLIAAVFLGNLPESISSAVGMRAEGRSTKYIVAVWTAGALACALASVLGYALLGGLSSNMISAMFALAAGGILAMLADTMMPEAFENGGPLVALGTTVGFLCAFLLSHATD